ncbi:MAG: hypothetical protein M5U34_08600 [Chloroflexi bacterium]|nr:hypothetical protein [Chloroflexota bacterium]
MNSKIPVEKIPSHFNLGEIIYLCHDLDINFEDLDGNTLTLKTVSLIEYCQRHEKIDDLRVHLQNLRPNVIWGNNDVEITNFSQPQFEITLVFDKAGSLIGDRPELIADLVELLYAVQNKEAVKLAVKYTENQYHRATNTIISK